MVEYDGADEYLKSNLLRYRALSAGMQGFLADHIATTIVFDEARDHWNEDISETASLEASMQIAMLEWAIDYEAANRKLEPLSTYGQAIWSQADNYRGNAHITVTRVHMPNVPYFETTDFYSFDQEEDGVIRLIFVTFLGEELVDVDSLYRISEDSFGEQIQKYFGIAYRVMMEGQFASEEALDRTMQALWKDHQDRIETSELDQLLQEWRKRAIMAKQAQAELAFADKNMSLPDSSTLDAAVGALSV